MPGEYAAAEKAIRAALTARAPLVASVSTRMYAYEAPQAVTGDYILFSLMSSIDEQGVGTKRVMTRALYQVEFITTKQPSHATVQSAAKEIDEALGKMVTRTVTDANNDSYHVSGRREGGSRVIGEKDARTQVTYYRVGGRYRLDVSAS